MTDDELIETLRARVSGVPTTLQQIEVAESQLGIRFPSLLRRVYTEVANGGFGPGHGVYELGAPSLEETLVGVHTHFSAYPEYPWPRRLLPICDWGCAQWSCVDCDFERGPIVFSQELRFCDAGRDLRGWFAAWLDGVDVLAELFEPGPIRERFNPFTRQTEPFVPQVLKAPAWVP